MVREISTQETPQQHSAKRVVLRPRSRKIRQTFPVSSQPSVGGENRFLLVSWSSFFRRSFSISPTVSQWWRVYFCPGVIATTHSGWSTWFLFLRELRFWCVYKIFHLDSSCGRGWCKIRRRWKSEQKEEENCQSARAFVCV